jgi:4-amino-4-deoxy-L-arabinose transferase-like glycosyltransferase
MSENLFYPLFTLSLFFMIKSLAESDKKWDILCGLTIGLAVLTKIIGLILLIVLAATLLAKSVSHPHSTPSSFYKKRCIFLSFGVIIIP